MHFFTFLFAFLGEKLELKVAKKAFFKLKNRHF